MLKLKVQVLAT